MQAADADRQQVKEHLKVLLFHFAKNSETPGLDLQDLLREVITELHRDVTEALKPKRHLKLVNQVYIPDA